MSFSVSCLWCVRSAGAKAFMLQKNLLPVVINEWSSFMVGVAAKIEKLWLCGARDFTHKREQVAFRVVEVIHPQLVSGHAGDEVRFVFKFYARRFKTLESGLDVCNLKIQNRS